MRRCTLMILVLPISAFLLTGLTRGTGDFPPPALDSAAGANATAPDASLAPEVDFMRRTIARLNPALLVEDAHCAQQLPVAIHQQALAQGLDWKRLFTLAWQESHFDCHAKNYGDRGGAFGPFQIRRLWQPLTGDPRHRYFDPHLAVERVAQVVRYYQDTNRYEELVRSHVRNPLLCLYNSGESQRLNLRYCRTVSNKLRLVEQGWRRYNVPRPDAETDAGAVAAL